MHILELIFNSSLNLNVVLESPKKRVKIDNVTHLLDGAIDNSENKFEHILNNFGGMPYVPYFRLPFFGFALGHAAKTPSEYNIFPSRAHGEWRRKDNARRSGKVVAITVRHVLLLCFSCMLIIFENHPNGFFTFTPRHPVWRL